MMIHVIEGKNQRKKINIWLVGKRVIAKAIKIQFEQRPKEDREEALQIPGGSSTPEEKMQVQKPWGGSMSSVASRNKQGVTWVDE